MLFTKISLLFSSKERVPYFIGSQIRGAFGYSLKKTVCINPSYSCEGCFATNNCLYHQFYEQKNGFHKYRLDFELGLKYYEFHFYLFDDATNQLPYVLSTLHTMLTQTGLGRDRVTFKEFDIYINDQSAMVDGLLQIPKEFQKELLSPPQTYERLKIQLQTPLRMKKENRFIRDDRIELKDIINSIYQREMQLLGKGFQKFPYKIEGEILAKDLHYKELTRESNRQKTTMKLGGIMGEIEIINLNKECYEVLKVGELIGVGKSTVFGLGKIKVEEIK